MNARFRFRPTGNASENTMGNTEIVAGIDIGSRSIEFVLLEGEKMVDWARTPTTYDPLLQCDRLIQSLHASLIVATGYGRKLFVAHVNRGGVTSITEIQAYAIGAKHLHPGARTVLDIGGQDTKVIALSSGGKVSKFEMNDRCAAGTGKFIEFMAAALQIPVEDFGGFALQAEKRIQINSMCTVFAESEATSLMARGEKAANIAMGLHLAILQRTKGMLDRVGGLEPLFFAGGVARNLCMTSLFREYLGTNLFVPENPDIVGALGAALYGRNRLKQG